MVEPDLPMLIDDLPRFAPVAGHFHDVPFYVSREMFGGVPIEIAGGEIAHLVETPVAATHRHDCPEIYLLLSPSPKGAVIEVEVNDQIFTVVSPAAFYVPAGAPHRFVTRRAERGSYCLGVLLPRASSGGA